MTKTERPIYPPSSRADAPISSSFMMARYFNLFAFLCFALLITNSQSMYTPNGFIPCGTCIKIVSILEKGGASTVEAEIPVACEAAVFFKSECEKILKPFVDTIVKGIEEELSPKAICETMSFC
uniref:Saposin B-type domain-containing protein n=1 Tax=Panagrellus redivivus TaxID=6233 RepID=A0A7E4WBW3_PANRE